MTLNKPAPSAGRLPSVKRSRALDSGPNRQASPPKPRVCRFPRGAPSITPLPSDSWFPAVSLRSTCVCIEWETSASRIIGWVDGRLDHGIVAAPSRDEHRVCKWYRKGYRGVSRALGSCTVESKLAQSILSVPLLCIPNPTGACDRVCQDWRTGGGD